MSDYEYTKAPIAHYQALQYPGEDGMTDEQAMELLTISIILG